VRHFDERAFVRKAQYMFGWDFAPRLVSAGIWRPVTLIEHAGRIRDVHAMQRHHEDGSVTLTLRSDVEGDGICWHRVVGPGVDAVVADGAPLRLVAPERWWPAGLGRPCLYTVTTLLVPPGRPATSTSRRWRATSAPCGWGCGGWSSCESRTAGASPSSSG
jgi:beta-mannosidase